MKNQEIAYKFKQLVKSVGYNQIRIQDINVDQLIEWSKQNLTSEVNQILELGWNLQDSNTWHELVFSNCVLNWYGNVISFYVTSSYVDFNLASKVISSPLFNKYREDFNFYNQVCLLLDPVIMIEQEDLDIIYQSLDIQLKYSILNLSHYADNESLKPEYLDDWGWLDDELKTTKKGSIVTGQEWSDKYIDKLIRS